MRSLCVAAIVMLVPSVASADRLEVLRGARGTATEISHAIDITVEPGLAVLRVDRTLKFSGPGKADIALFADLPLGGVITNLKLQGGGEAEVQSDGNDAIFIFPGVKARSKRRISYRVEVPLTAKEGQSTVWLPQARTSGGAMAPVVRQGGEVLLPQDNPTWDPVVVPMPTPESGRARWGAARLSSGWAWRMEVDAPRSFGETIDRANIVFLLDVSRSQARKGIDRQLTLLQEWARQMPRARYQVIAYHRDVTQVFATWKGADGIRDLGPGHTSLAPQNGSNIDGALELAASLLKGEEGPAFVLVATDGEAPVVSTPPHLSQRLDSLGTDAVVHLLVTSGRHKSGAIETRADEHRLAPIALDHGGVPVSVYLPDSWPTPPEKLALRNLLRTTRIDRYDTIVDGKAHLGDSAGMRLYAGQGAVSSGRSESAPKSAAPSGLAWGRPWTMKAVRTAAADRRAALFAVHGLAGAERLGDADLEDLGRRLKFVTAKTALKVTRSGTEVVTPQKMALGSGAPRGVPGGVPGTSAGRGSVPAAEIETSRVSALFGPMYGPCIADYRGPGGTMQISVEMSWNEILDVSAVGGDTASNLCVEESIWAADIADEFHDAHAFGMVEEPLKATSDGEIDSGDQRDEGGPPETNASRSGGCNVGTPGQSAWLLLFGIFAIFRRRRLRLT